MKLLNFKYKSSFSSFIIFVILMYCTFDSKAQNMVGINQNDPQSTLDIGGAILLDGNLYLGGSDSQIGNAGNKVEALTSFGLGNAAQWVNVDYLFTGSKDGYFLRDSFVLKDTEGLEIPYSSLSGAILYPDGISPYPFKTYDTDTSSKIYEMKNLSFTSPYSIGSSMIILVRIQTGVIAYYDSTQPGASQSPWNTYAIGVAMEDPASPGLKTLVAIRSGSCYGVINPYSAYYMEYTIDASTVPKGAKLSVVCFYRNTSNASFSYNPSVYNQGSLFIGRDKDGGKSFLMEASATFEVYEKL